MARKTQLEKFEERQRKARERQGFSTRIDEEVIKEKELKESTLEGTAQKIGKKHGLTTEDIFAVIARDSIPLFVKMWNNSMESVVRQTIRTEIKDMVQATVREEMAAAYRGIVRGLTSSNEIFQEMAKEEIANLVNDELSSSNSKEPKPKVKRRNAPMEGVVYNWQTPSAKELPFYAKLKTMIIECAVDPKVGKYFKKQSGAHNGAYQKFMSLHRGLSGAWLSYVNHVLESAQQKENGEM